MTGMSAPGDGIGKARLYVLELAFLVFLAAIAIFSRLYGIGQAPPGIHPEEATVGVMAQDVLRGQLPVFSPRQGGEGVLITYLAALSILAGGANILTMRLFASFIGIASILLAYFSARELFLYDGGELDARLVAGLAVLHLVISPWHLDLSRIVFAMVLTLLVESLLLYQLWHAVRSGRRGHFALTGFLLGLVMYGYIAGYVMPLLLFCYFMLEWAIRGRNSLTVRYRRGLLLAAGLALLLVLPLGWYVASNSAALAERALGRSVASPLGKRPDFWAGLGFSLLTHLDAFGFTLQWLSGRQAALLLDPLSTAMFLLGFAFSIWRAGRPAYRFLLLWWAATLLPSILGAEGMIPHPRRAIGALLPTLIFVSLGWLTVVGFLPALWRRLKGRDRAESPALRTGYCAASVLVIGLLLGRSGYATWQNYFAQAKSEAIQDAYHLYEITLVEEMERETNPAALYVLPLDVASGTMWHQRDVISFLYRGVASFVNLFDDEETLPAGLTAAAQGKDTVHVVEWNLTKHSGADPKGLLPFLLEQHGERVGTKEGEYYDIITYNLSSTSEHFSLPESFRPAEVSFGGQLRLVGYAYGGDGPEVPGGERLGVILKWRKEGPREEDYKVSVRLQDSAGHLVAQNDKLLLNNYLHKPTSSWAGGEEQLDYYLLQVAPATLPGDYQLRVIVYSGAEEGRLKPEGGELDLSFHLGDVRVTRPLRRFTAEELTIPLRLEQEIDGSLALLGIGLEQPPQPVLPGEKLEVTLYWLAKNELPREYGFSLWLMGPTTANRLTDAIPLGPAGEWGPGEVFMCWQDVRIPAEVESGEHSLGLKVEDTSTGEMVQAVFLAAIEVAQRPRLYDEPDIANRLPSLKLGQQAELPGYDLPASPLRPGDELRVTLYWRSLQPTDTPYNVFLHLLNEAGQVVAQVDREPGEGRMPVPGWLPGEVIVDVYSIALPAGLPPGEYTLAAGMYDGLTGDRLEVRDEAGRARGDSVRLGRVTVVP